VGERQSFYFHAHLQLGKSHLLLAATPCGGKHPGVPHIKNTVPHSNQLATPWSPAFKQYFSVSICYRRLSEKAVNTTCNVAVLPRRDGQVANSHPPATLCFQSQQAADAWFSACSRLRSLHCPSRPSSIPSFKCAPPFYSLCNPVQLMAVAL